MRSIWSGSISLGLVNIPVNIVSAVSSETIDFDLIHKRDGCPINYARVCRRTGQEIPYDQIVRAYKLDKNVYVIMEEEDFEAANIKKYNTISILSFSPANEVNKLFFEKPYYLRPQEGAERAYSLFCEVLKQSGKSALGKYVLRNREHLALIEPRDQILILYQLRFNQEVKQPDFDIPSFKLDRKEIDLARALVESLSEPFDITKFRDTYTDDLMNIIRKKAKGQKIRTPEPISHKEIPDLVKALEESLKNVDQTREDSHRV